MSKESKLNDPHKIKNSYIKFENIHSYCGDKYDKMVT